MPENPKRESAEKPQELHPAENTPTMVPPPKLSPTVPIFCTRRKRNTESVTFIPTRNAVVSRRKKSVWYIASHALVISAQSSDVLWINDRDENNVWVTNAVLSSNTATEKYMLDTIRVRRTSGRYLLIAVAYCTDEAI